jgi:hypothetical protein
MVGSPLPTRTGLRAGVYLSLHVSGHFPIKAFFVRFVQEYLFVECGLEFLFTAGAFFRYFGASNS